MKNILAVDSETTGLFHKTGTPCRRGKHYYQSISWGMIAADEETLEAKGELYVEIQWDGESLWEPQAERVHGLSKQHLKEHGSTKEDAVVEIATFIDEHFPNRTPIILLGHNVATFDLPFLRDLMGEFNIELNLNNRHIDTFSSSFTMFNCKTSQEMCDMLDISRVGYHNALDDARMALVATQRMRSIIDEVCG